MVTPYWLGRAILATATLLDRQRRLPCWITSPGRYLRPAIMSIPTALQRISVIAMRGLGDDTLPGRGRRRATTSITRPTLARTMPTSERMPERQAAAIIV